jgi:hypothetical protein
MSVLILSQQVHILTDLHDSKKNIVHNTQSGYRTEAVDCIHKVARIQVARCIYQCLVITTVMIIFSEPRCLGTYL